MELIKLLLQHLLVILSRQEVEAVDSKGLNIGTILENYCADTFHRVVPFAVLDMNLAFLSKYWLEVRVQHCDLRKCRQAFIVALGLF